MRRRKSKKQRKIIIVTSLSLLFIMTVGYAAFQTNLNITAKGNIIDKGITTKELKDSFVTSGDGLYKDTYENGRYIYKGANPDNYITFNDELWRIISVENNGELKIIKSEDIGMQRYDSAGARTTGYCSGSHALEYGCNPWMKTSNFINGTLSGAVDKDAELNIYLNTTYYSSLGDLAKEKIVSYSWGVGPVLWSNASLSDQINRENQIKWDGKVALPSASDYIRTSNNSKCTSLNEYYFSADGSCYRNPETHNWLYDVMTNNDTKLGWLLTPHQGDVYSLFSANGQSGREGSIDRSYARGTSRLHVSPTVYLGSNIRISGMGTKEKPYIIK